MTVRVEDTLAVLRRRERNRRRRAEARAQALRHKLPEAARLLKNEYGASRLVLFGSLASGGVTENSDVDLAVEGLEPELYFPALADLMGLFGTGVDLVRVEHAPPSLAERIQQEGVAL